MDTAAFEKNRASLELDYRKMVHRTMTAEEANEAYQSEESAKADRKRMQRSKEKDELFKNDLEAGAELTLKKRAHFVNKIDGKTQRAQTTISRTRDHNSRELATKKEINHAHQKETYDTCFAKEAARVHRHRKQFDERDERYSGSFRQRTETEGEARCVRVADKEQKISETQVCKETLVVGRMKRFKRLQDTSADNTERNFVQAKGEARSVQASMRCEAVAARAAYRKELAFQVEQATPPTVRKVLNGTAGLPHSNAGNPDNDPWRVSHRCVTAKLPSMDFDFQQTRSKRTAGGMSALMGGAQTARPALSMHRTTATLRHM